MPRPRSQQADHAILLAAQELLQESGLRSVTMEAIARRAGVGKQTVYRRYADRNAVLAAVWLQDAESRVEVPRGRSLERDLALFLERLFAALQTSGDALRHLLAQAQFDDDLRETFREEFIAHRRATLADIVRRHSQPADADVEAVVDMLYGTMWYRLLTAHAPLNPALAKRLARMAAAALAASEGDG